MTTGERSMGRGRRGGGDRRAIARGVLAGLAGGVIGAASAAALGIGLGLGSATQPVSPRRDIRPLDERLAIISDGVGGRFAQVDFDRPLRRIVFSNFGDTPEPVSIAQFRTQPERLQERSVVVVPAGDTVVIEGRFLPREINGVRTSGLFHRVLTPPSPLGRSLFVTGITNDGLINEIVAFVGDR